MGYQSNQLFEKNIMDIETIYSNKLYNEMLSNAKAVEHILNQANKDIAKRIGRFELRHPETIYQGSFYKINRQLAKQVDDMMNILHKELQNSIESGMANGWNLANKKNAILVDSYTKGVALSSAIRESFNQLNLNAMTSFIGRTESGMNLSKRVWKLTEVCKDQLELYLSSGISTGKSAAGISIDVRKYLKEPEKLFRRVRKDGKLVLSKTARGYHPGAGIYRSSFKNARRLTATETNMAYRMSDFTRRQQLPFVTGIEVHLSGMHPRMDLCDDLQGKYPKGFMFGGWHVLCICYSTSIKLNKDEFIDFINTGNIRPQRFIRTIPKSAGNWIEKNKGKIARYKSRSYFLRDNFTKDFKLKKQVIKIQKI